MACHDGMLYAEAPSEAPEDAVSEASQALPVDRATLDFVYPCLPACTAPTKLTATQLKGREKDREIAENTVQPYTHKEFAAPKFLSAQQPLAPAARGTAVHLVMQYLPLDGSAAETVKELLARRIMTPEQAEVVDLRAIEGFLASPLAGELRRAEQVEREFRFSLLVPAGDYYEDLSDEDQVLLQGVVDLFAVIDGEITVVDFKTDRITVGNLQEKIDYYRPQLAAYSRALEQIMGLPVAHRVLYFFGNGQAVEI